ncbi:MAG: metal ABC transporter ATP-binding protein [Deltaproteobacteria bacterium]|nr:metal ABC transporter ATP-binding protein [Deltaproteobacteria bacterium]
MGGSAEWPTVSQTPQTQPNREKEKCVFEARNISKAFGELQVLKDVSFWIPEGEFLCLVGPNGAGKSTLLKIILGLLEPDTGHVRVHGKEEINSHTVGYVPQRKHFHASFPARVEELVAANLRGTWPVRIRAAEKEKVEKVLERVGASDLWGKAITDLSGGEMQRVFLARALVTEPNILILDEPEAGVDVMGRRELIDMLYEISCSDVLAAILVSHHPETIARTAERVLYLDRRVIAWGLPDELLGHAYLPAIADPRLKSTRYDDGVP